MAEQAVRWLMTAAGEPITAETLERPSPGAGEVLVEVAGCGVCHTDLGFYYDGVRTNLALPLTLGHEISGRVIATGPGTDSWTGRSVIIPAVIPCGECNACRRGKGTICRDQRMPGNDIHGGFATHVVVPAHGLCPVDESALAACGLELADVSVLADAITTPYQAAVQAGVGAGDLAVVVGAGGVGGYAVQIANAMGATVAAVDISQAKLDAIADHGAALTLNARDLDGRAVKKAVLSLAEERGLRATEWIIFECSGTTAGQLTAYGLLTHGATLCVVGFTMAKVELRLSNLMAFHARALGNWGCAPELYPQALELVTSGRIAVTPFIGKHPLADINHVFEAVHGGEVAHRPILVPDA